MLKHILAAVILCGFSCLARAEVDMTGCDPVPPPLAGSFGPYDYNNPIERAKAPLVENAHFTAQVENLSHGQSGTAVMPDIQYTLTKYPNHPRALQSLVRLSVKEKSEQPMGAARTVTCFLKRAIVFAPNDMIPRMLLAKHYSQQGKVDDALKVLQEAEILAPGDANLAYNMGLLYVEKKQYDQALIYAHKGYQAGFPLPGLRDKLKRAGQWREPEPKTVDADAKPAPAEAPVAPAAPNATAPSKQDTAPPVTTPADAAAPVRP